MSGLRKTGMFTLCVPIEFEPKWKLFRELIKKDKNIVLKGKEMQLCMNNLTSLAIRKLIELYLHRYKKLQPQPEPVNVGPLPQAVPEPVNTVQAQPNHDEKTTPIRDP